MLLCSTFDKLQEICGYLVVVPSLALLLLHLAEYLAVMTSFDFLFFPMLLLWTSRLNNPTLIRRRGGTLVCVGCDEEAGVILS